MSQSENPPFSTSPLSYPLPKWRYWIMFQSWGQVRSYLLIILVSALALHSLALLAGVRLLPIAVLLGAMAVGGLISVLMVMPARFTVAPSSEHAVARVIDELKFMRYIENGVQDNAVVYRQNLPRVLRWNEGNIRLARDGADLVVSGPVTNVSRVRKGLLSRR